MAAVDTLVKDLCEGDSVDMVLGVKESSLRQTSTGGHHIHLSLCDASGAIPGKKWSASDPEFAAIREAHFLHVRGFVQAYQGQLQIIATSLSPVQDPPHPERFIPATKGNRRRHFELLKEFVETIQEPSLRALMRRLFQDQAFRERYYQVPAAEAMHHAVLGGLLEHTLEVAALCMAVCDRVPTLKRDLLMVGALLHDVGKTEELGLDAVNYVPTVDGGLIGHVVLGPLMVDRAIAEIPDFPPGLRAAVLHLIVSHHGNREWGAPVSPAFAEAFVLHYCDQISAKLAMCQENTENGSGLFAWAKGLSGRLFLGEIPCETPATPPTDSLRDVFDGDLRPAPPLRPAVQVLASLPAADEALPEMIALPIVGRIAAGTPIDAEEHVEGYRAVPLGAITGVKDFLLRVTGDSMQDAHILDGDLVRVRPATGEPREGEIVAALINGDVTVKRFQRHDGGILLHAENPAFPDIPVAPADDFHIQGTVVGLIRETVC